MPVYEINCDEAGENGGSELNDTKEEKKLDENPIFNGKFHSECKISQFCLFKKSVLAESGDVSREERIIVEGGKGRSTNMIYIDFKVEPKCTA